jgi:Right handed beta helix region
MPEHRARPTFPARSVGLTIILLAAVMGLRVPVAAADPCTSDCSQAACSVDCTEASIRDGIAKANNCLGDGAWTGRSITLEGTACTASGNTVHLLNDATGASSGAFPDSTCASDPAKFALCVLNDDVHFLGSGAMFIYDGGDPCGQCGGNCPTGAALFTLEGNRDSVENLSFRYFPEGIHIRKGNDNAIVGVTSDRICEDAFTIDTTAGTGESIRDCVLIGSQDPDPGRSCDLANGSKGACGTDKAIQINGGGSTLSNNVIDTISQPISAGAGTHRLENNSSTGSPDDQNICQSYTVTGSATVTFVGNAIDHCKFGIRADGNALVIAEDNTITNPWVSAFNVRASGRLKGQGNRIRTRSAGFTNVSDVQRGLVVARNDEHARVDLGGGDFAGVSVVDGTPCASGGDCSSGGNKFCSDGAAVQTDIWNVTDCPCLDQLCSGTPQLCTVDACAPLEAAGTCDGTGGAGASIGARTNCFAGGVADVKDAAPVTTDTGGATACSLGDCAF